MEKKNQLVATEWFIALIICSTKSGYNTYRGWTQLGYQNKHYIINQSDEETQDDLGRDEGTNFILRIKEQETRLPFRNMMMMMMVVVVEVKY